ncbi:MAG TPA: hypothetical protein VGZ25_12510 [Gemmataceae bacterium]|nr:hypothetical protein [Gemmataceae bacterium]
MKRNSRLPVLVLTTFCLALAAFCVSGCEKSSYPLPPDDFQPDPSYGSLFDARQAGSIEGQVIWQGPPPSVPPFHAPVSPRTEQFNRDLFDWPNPNGPQIEQQTGAVQGAVVFLKEVDPRKAKRWDLDPVLIEVRDYQFHIRQGNQVRQTGFVRRGDEVIFDSQQEAFHSIHAEGAAFFSLPFADSHVPSKRPLTRAGLIELTSGAGYFWMRGYLFVADHPYFARTDSHGRFSLTNVPSGTYELVCWMPNWHEDRHDRDPETCCWTRLFFRPTVGLKQSTVVSPLQTTRVSFAISETEFP